MKAFELRMKYVKLYYSERSSPPILNYYLRVEMIGVSPKENYVEN